MSTTDKTHCSICGEAYQWNPCPMCGGEEGEHIDGEWVMCDNCEGEGGFWGCPNFPHQDKEATA